LVSSATLFLVDLGGSEQVKKSAADGARLAEAIEINSSLMVLGRCIDALVLKRAHVPYYESKLTMLLAPALGGTGARHTAVLVCASGADRHGDETLHALRFGERCGWVAADEATGPASTAPMADVLRSLAAQEAECAAEVAKLAKLGAGDRAKLELGDSKLRGLGVGHEASRLQATVAHAGGTHEESVAGHATSQYTFVDDLAGRWVAETARLEMLRQRRKDLLGE
jgi:hypothetical protein